MKFKVRVLRIAYGEIEVEVKADNRMRAMVAAITTAKDQEISTQRSEYEVVGIYSITEEDLVACEECGELTERRPKFTVCERCERALGS